MSPWLQTNFSKWKYFLAEKNRKEAFRERHLGISHHPLPAWQNASHSITWSSPPFHFRMETVTILTIPPPFAYLLPRFLEKCGTWLRLETGLSPFSQNLLFSLFFLFPSYFESPLSPIPFPLQHTQTSHRESPYFYFVFIRCYPRGSWRRQEHCQMGKRK